MKLISLYVSSFGKLKDFSYDFNDNFNVIKQDNGWGKSTLATFIKSVFYGLSGSRLKSVAENERAKYKPWNSTDKFGGYVVFEWGGKQYKLERYFGAKEVDDTLTLTDLETGKNYPNPENIGKRIFQIDEEGFLSTTYFSQKEFTVKSSTSITAKYNSVCEIQPVETFDDAVKMLEEKAKELKARGDKGKISQKKQEIADINDQIAAAHKAGSLLNIMNKSILGLEEETEKLRKEKDDLSKKVGEFGERQALLEKKKNYQSLLADKKDFLSKRENILSKVLNKEPNGQEVAEKFNQANDVFTYEKSRNDYTDALNNFEAEKQSVIGQNISKLWLVLLVLSSLFLLGGIVGLVVSQMLVGIISMLVAAIFGAFTIVNYSISKKKTNESANIYDKKILECQAKIDNCSRIISTNKNILENYLRVYGLEKMDIPSALNTLADIVRELSSLDEKINFVDKLLDKHDQTLISKFNSLTYQTDEVELDVRLKNVQNEYDQKFVKLVDLKNEKNTYSQLSETLPELEGKKLELAEELEGLVEEHRILELTHQYLLKADENLKIKYRAPLKNSLNKYFSLITGKTDGVDIDIDLNVTGVEKEGNKIPEYYSKGYQNLFEICKRFALTDVLFTGEKPFIILDDPFYNLDEDKIKTALELVSKLSKEYQIIYFACHESRV